MASVELQFVAASSDNAHGFDQPNFAVQLIERFKGGPMSKIWDEREKSLENEYFRRKEQELIEKLRARRAEEESAEAAIIHCPKCDGVLAEISFEGVQIDRCDKCHGVWLDAGELELLIGQEKSGWLSRMWQSLAS